MWFPRNHTSKLPLKLQILLLAVSKQWLCCRYCSGAVKSTQGILWNFQHPFHILAEILYLWRNLENNSQCSENVIKPTGEKSRILAPPSSFFFFFLKYCLLMKLFPFLSSEVPALHQAGKNRIKVGIMQFSFTAELCSAAALAFLFALPLPG